MFPKTPSQTAKTFKGTRTLTLKQVPYLSDGTGGITNSALANTNKIIGIALHPRALGMAAWTSFANDEFAGVPLGQVQMSYFTDPLTGFPFRLDLWYTRTCRNTKCDARLALDSATLISAPLPCSSKLRLAHCGSEVPGADNA